MLDARFPPYSPGSRRLYDFEELGEQQLLNDEVRRTIGELDRVTSARISKGQMTSDEAIELARTWSAIAADLEAQDQWLLERSRSVPAWTLASRLAELRRGNGIAWADKVAALRRQLEHRRSSYPDDVAKGRLDQASGRAQLERPEAVHDLYWRQGFAFDGTLEELRAMSAAILDYDVEQQGAASVNRGDSSRVEQPASTSREDGGATPPPRSIAGAASGAKQNSIRRSARRRPCNFSSRSSCRSIAPISAVPRARIRSD